LLAGPGDRKIREPPVVALPVNGWRWPSRGARRWS